MNNPKKSYRPTNGIFYNSYGELWFIWKFLLRSVFIFGCIYIVIGIISAFHNPDFDMTDKGFLWFSGAVSVYFAFVEMD